MTLLDQTWEKKLKSEDTKKQEPKDLEIPLIDLEKEPEEPTTTEDEDEDDDFILETHATLHHLPEDCPFTFSTYLLRIPGTNLWTV